MYKILITTKYFFGGGSIHTVIAEFDDHNRALKAIATINNNKNMLSSVDQNAVALF